MEINLNFRRKDFEEIYSTNNAGSYIKDESIKTIFRNLMITVASVFCLLIYSYYKNSYGFFKASLIVLGVFCIAYFDQAIGIKRWRKSVKIYFEIQEKFKNNKLIVTDSYFSIIQDSTESLEKWSNLERAKISDKFIWLLGNENYLIPAKSMTKDDYEKFRRVVSEKFKQD
jgi:hypothetical protein